MFSVRFGFANRAGLGGRSLEERLCNVGGGSTIFGIFLNSTSLLGREMASPIVLRSTVSSLGRKMGGEM